MIFHRVYYYRYFSSSLDIDVVKHTPKGKKLPFLTLQDVHFENDQKMSQKLASKPLESYR